MGMEKAIASGKEHRKEYQKYCEQIDKSCRCHGGCAWCRANRLYANDKKMKKILDELKEWCYNESIEKEDE